MSTDAEIVRRAGNNPRAFAELFERHSRAIAGFAIRRVGVDAADDVVSETFMIAYRKLSSFDPNATTALPWLFGIAARQVRKMRATEMRHLRAMSAAAPEHLPDASPRVDDRLDAQTRMQALAPALAKLAPRDRETLLLYAWGDLTYEQIAEALKVPVGTVRSRLNRVRNKLRTARPTVALAAAHQMGEHA